MITPPRFTQTLLESVGARRQLAEAVLGDLTEEFHERASRDGERSARHWFVRESFRALPHLLNDSVRTLCWRDVRRLLGVALSAYVFLLFVFMFAAYLVMAVWRALDPIGSAAAMGGPQPRILALVVPPLAVFGGYLASWMEDRRPILGALTLAVGWCIAGLVQLAMLARRPDWLDILGPFVVLLAVAVEGLLQLRWRSSRAMRRLGD
jgi:hypothetical protein